MALTNQDGQPLQPAFNRARRIERDISEMLGLVKGVLGDGAVTTSEAELLRDWIESHPDARSTWPINRIHERLELIFEDGRVDEGERIELADLLQSIVGGQAGIIVGSDAASELPVDKPTPAMRWNGSIFVFTGKFAYGPRKACEGEVVRLGGRCSSTITKSTGYVIIGTFGSRDWIHTSFGRKIEKAVKYRDSGCDLSIVSEDQWAAALPPL
jgi:hypothetical protein